MRIVLGARHDLTAASTAQTNRLRALLRDGDDIEDVDLTRADRRSYASYASAQQYKDSQRIGVEYRPRGETDDGR